MSDTLSGEVAVADFRSNALVGLHGFFKRCRSLTTRKQDSDTLRSKYQDKIPVIIERYGSERALPILEQSKYLVPSHLTMRELTVIIRRKLSVSRFKTFYFLVNNRTIVNNCASMSEIYNDEKDEDGFLYMVYASQDTFGEA